MAKQVSDTIITGTQGNLVFYEMEGKGFVRTRSSLTGKQFKTKACFAKSRKSAERFGLGNRLAAEIYRQLPANKRSYKLFCRLKTNAIQLLKEGKSAYAVLIYLKQSIPTLRQTP